MIGCLEVRRMLPRFQGLELAPDVEREIRLHLEGCAECREAAAGREPALAVAWAAAAERAPEEDERFVAEVLGQIHQRRLEHRLGGKRSRVMAAAAAVAVALLGGTVAVRHFAKPAAAPTVTVAAAPRPRPAAGDPAFIEVEGAGVRLYQLAPAAQSRDAVQVAFIVDPHLEL